MSKDKQPVIKEMKDKTKDFQQDKLEFIKSPVVLEFLGLPGDASLAESKLESAIIDNLEKFLMEMGKGYALVARQQHIRTEENDYYIDLVFYNYLIKSFILVDLKVNRITYQDVGQMDMYLQMYDNMKKGLDDNPTIGIILCAETDSDVHATPLSPRTTKCWRRNTNSICQTRLTCEEKSKNKKNFI